MKSRKSIILFVLALITVALFTGCSSKKEKILIYSSNEDYVIEDMQNCLDEKFPNYDITIEYMSTGDHAAKLISEGKNTKCDITHDLEYPYLQKLEEAGLLADVTEFMDTSVFAEDVMVSKYYIPQLRNGGGIIINTKLLKEKNLAEPKSYSDLLKPEYKNLICMPNPKSSGTGYMFLLSLINSMGEDNAFEYFDKLSENVYQFTSSGSGPINALLQEEAVIGLGMTSQAVVKINEENAPLKILFFDEGSPYSMYGQAIIAGKETRECVKEVLDYLANEYADRLGQKFFPEKLFKDKIFEVDNFPKDIKYADMSNNTPENKERFLAKWKY